MSVAPAPSTSLDSFLGGRVLIEQPLHGYRAATDPVLLAAATCARRGETVLDAGCGVGTAALCLAARVPGIDVSGLELQPDLADLAMRNAHRNGIALTVHHGDLANPPAALRSCTFDHVITNPPFFEKASAASPTTSRDLARRETALDLQGWIRACLRRLRQGGWLTVIHRTERLPALLAALEGRAGSIVVRPLAARIGRPASRIVLRARKDRRGPFTLAPPLVLHDGLSHGNDEDDFTTDARAILRGAAPLDFGC
jgi:tRNA1(Val) A37 N6-methylase TrmN6